MKRTLLWSGCLLLAGRAHAQEPAVRAPLPGAFEQGTLLQAAPKLAVQTFLLPLEVEQRLRSRTPMDLAVFDAKEQPVPHAVRALSSPPALQRAEQELPLFPLLARAHQPADTLTLHVERSARGEVIDIRSQRQPHADDASAQLQAYVLDASRSGAPLAALLLTLEAGDDNFTVPVLVEESDDLTTWQVCAQAVLARLVHQGQRLERTRIELPGAARKFLRLRWPDQAPPVRVLSARAELRPVHSAAEPPLHTATVTSKQEGPGRYLAQLPGPLCAHSVRVHLPDNALAQARLSSEAGAQLFAGQLYRLRHAGQELESPPIVLGTHCTRALRLTVTAGADALPPSLRFDVRYVPDQLLFLARGEGPFLLAYGLDQPPAAQFSAEQLLAMLPEPQRHALPTQSARALGSKVLAGPKRPAPAPLLSRTQVLWGVLVLTALSLLALALRMLRKVR